MKVYAKQGKLTKPTIFLCRLLVPVGTFNQYMTVYDKAKDGTIHEHKWLGVMVSFELAARLFPKRY